MVVTVKAKLSNELFLLPHDLLAAPQKPLVKLSARLISFSHLQNKNHKYQVAHTAPGVYHIQTMLRINNLHALRIPSQLTLVGLTKCRKLLQRHFPIHQTKWTLKILFSLPALSIIFLRGQVSILLRKIRQFLNLNIEYMGL